MTQLWAGWVLLIAGLGQAATETDKPAPPPQAPSAPVAVESGKVRGLLVGEKQDVRAFKGIPYAAPPVGDLRWKPPAAPASWEGVRDCFEFSSACPQRTPTLMKAIPQMAINAPYSEDCLYLNVWAPENAKGLPVLYWIHGGGYTMGASSQPIYNGEELARLGCVVVSINYRLGPFGFLAHPALSAESATKTSGNYGLLDQIAGLKWVQRNIAAFGGDPKKVAIFGESAGGGSVLALLVSPEAKGLFRAAAAQSAPEMNLARLREAHRGHPAAETQGQKLIAECGLSESADASQMRGLDADVLVKVFPALEVDRNVELRLQGIPLPVGPIIDGQVIPDDPNIILAAGRENDVPLIVGNTRDEMSMFLAATRTPADAATYTKELQDDFGHLAEAIATAYPGTNGREIRAAVMQLLGDITFVSQARYAARAHSDAGNKTFRYEFARGSNQGILKQMGAHHGSELAYLFQQPAKPDDNDRKIAGAMARYWINLAETGDPNGEGLPPWPAYSRKNEEMVEFADDVTIVKGPRSSQLDIIDKHLQLQREPTQSAGSGN